MKLSDEQIKDILEELKPSIVDGLKIDLQNSINTQIDYDAREIIGQLAKNWIKEHIVPEIEKALIESKDGLVSVGINAVDELTTALARSLTDMVKQKLENNWERKKIFEALIG